MDEEINPKQFVAHGAGFSGEFDAFEEARAVVSQNRQGGVYQLICSCQEAEACRWCAEPAESRRRTEGTK